MGIFVETVGQYKSTCYETARSLFRSRNTQRARAERQTQQLLFQLQQENEQLRQQPIMLPTDLPLPNHSFGPRTMALCMNLSQHIGFRPTETTLKIVFEWHGIDAKVPSFSSTGIWLCRAGIDPRNPLDAR